MRSTEFPDAIRNRLAPPREDARRILNAGEIALFCGVSRRRVLDWIDGGLLSATRLADGGHRIRAGDFRAFLGRFDILGAGPAEGAG